jgi:hypothetical protein
MAFSLLALAVLQGSPEAQLAKALDEAVPPPALRAAFHATLSTDNGVRRIEYDPYAPAGQQFFVTQSYGKDEELDAVVNAWRAEGQADVRLFADDLRSSMGEGKIAKVGDSWDLQFRHQISPKDGPVDRLISPLMNGELQLNPANGHLARITYSIERPFKLDNGTTVSEYRQSYSFGYSWRWGVSYVQTYELEARGGKWGLSESRRVKVELTDISFCLASDARQVLQSKPAAATRSVASR